MVKSKILGKKAKERHQRKMNNYQYKLGKEHTPLFFTWVTIVACSRVPCTKDFFDLARDGKNKITVYPRHFCT